ncbi:hypothetical protein COLO4_16006 [Corchorus olitorius]|uniref:Uncharacterized protein n=1 Tax=Corchorus olitorius TaxID=93759 RepID=A0A1R3JKA4_9ROSI|nr:hypothetical protein COLO4_16006 [Corchorus olitorius]
MEMAVEPWRLCSPSFIFLPNQNKSHLHQLIYFPFCPLSHSHLHRRFCSYAAGDNSSSRRRGRSKWDSNAETIRAKGFSFNTQNEDDDNEEEYEEMASSGILEEAIDSIWILKVFKSFGWTLPPILLSILFATGPKAFLMALAVPLGQSAITLAFQKLVGMSQGKQKRKARVRRKTKNTSPRTVKKAKMKEQAQEGQKSRKRTKDYQSWVVSDDTSVNESGQDASSFGGWDELDGMGSMRVSSTVASGSKTTSEEKGKLSMKRSTNDAPLLLRLLIAVFPFLGSWTKLF